MFILLGTTIIKDGGFISVEFMEYKCDTKQNRAREQNGDLPPNYTCSQVRHQTSVSRDVDGRPVDVVVNKRAGCELRCITKHCGRKP